MSLQDLRTAMKEAKAKWLADKTDKEARKVFRAAKAALTKAKEAAEKQKKLKRQAEETNDKPAKKKTKTDNPPSKRIFLGNLDYDINDAKCKDFFEDCGELVNFYWMRDQRTRRFKGTGIVEFATQEGADKAILKNGKTFMGRVISVSYASPREKKEPGTKKKKSPAPPSKKIYLMNVSDKIDNDKIKEFFKDCGELVEIFWPTTPDRKFKGIGIVEFATQEQADKALKKSGEMLLDKKIKCRYAEPRRKKENKEKGGPKSMEIDDDTSNPPSTRLFVKNLPFKVDRDKFKGLFKDSGEVVDIFWMLNPRKKFSGNCIVEFATQEGADKALSKNGTEFMSRDLKIFYAKDRKMSKNNTKNIRKLDDPPSEKYPGCDTVFVGHMFKDDDDAITELFKECGKITKIKWVKDKFRNKFKGVGFISFANPDVALPIAMAFHGKEFHGKQLRVDYVKPRNYKM